MSTAATLDPRAAAASPSFAERLRSDPAFQAFTIMRIAFTVAPILFGLDKFFNLMVDWEGYLAPWIDDIIPGSASTAMHLVGVVEIVAGIFVALKPRYGAYVVAAWLAGIIVDLLTYSGYYDVALRDFGLLLGALTLARLASVYDPPGLGLSRRAVLTVLAVGTLGVATIGASASAPAANAAAMSGHTMTMPGHAMTAGKARTTPKALALHDAMRDLWQAHGTWTERAIVDYVGGLPDAEAAIARLLENQAEIGDAVKPFYGAKGGAELTKLLKAHINAAVALLVAAKSGDASATAKAKAAFYANGDEVAAFLHAANPRQWSLQSMRTMMRVHLDQVVGLAVDQLEGRYGAAIDLYSHYIDHLLDMADMLSNGIVHQFPARFR
jgi:uncharacterized membrane protein YphA (DoxX/SURF4 family)